jgi:hypothetical protein
MLRTRTDGLERSGRATTGVFAGTCLLLLLSSPALATNHFTRIEQVMVGANGDTDIQFIEMKFESSSQNEWAGRTTLTFHDAAGNQIAQFPIPTNPPVGVSDGSTSFGFFSALIATQEFVDKTGLAADILLPGPMMSPVSGMVCFVAGPAIVFPVRHCLSYGSFTGPMEFDVCGSPNGPPAPALPFMGAPMSLTRFEDLLGDFECGHENSNFRLEVPEPRNSAGRTVVLENEALRMLGQQIFDNETFDGNGRTCATCHDAAVGFGLRPEGVADRFVDDPQDPLFIAENDPALADLENACLMRGGDQRALILENIDGFSNDPVFRGSPHLLNIALTAPYSLSGGTPDLRTFSEGAVIQHFTQTLARGAADFRPPTSEELEALEVFMKSIVFPSDGNLDLDRMIAFDIEQNGSDPARIQRGRDLFFGPQAQCSRCHSGPALSDSDGSLGTGTGNQEFNTGVVSLIANQDDGCIGGPGDPTLPLPSEAGGNREFSTPPLVGVATTAPFFHDNSVTTLVDAVQFYDTAEFRLSPAAALLPSPISLPFGDILDIVVFLEAISVDPADNCPGVPNPDQTDSNGDGAGDACQPSVDVSPVVPQGVDLFAEIEIADPQDDPLNGAVQVVAGRAAPISIRFEALKTSCDSQTNETDLLLNGAVIGTISGNPRDCTCTPFGGPARVDISGSPIGDNWNAGDVNTLRVLKPGFGTLLTWAKATLVFDEGPAEEVCIHHATGGIPQDCSERSNLCRFDTTFVEVDKSVSLDFSVLLLTETYANSELPTSLDISSLEAGDYLLRATTTDGKTPEVSDEEPFTKTDEAQIIINNQPPDCIAATASSEELWPPRHEFEDVSVVGVTDPDGDPIAITITAIAQDEPPLQGLGSGHTCPDASGVGTPVASLLTERSGTLQSAGGGRVYHISFTAADGRGGECSGKVSVCAPHDQRQGVACVDGGPIFDSMVCEMASDADQDSLADFFETCTGIFVSATDTGTCPDVADADGDSRGDFAELVNGTNPVDPQSFVRRGGARHR